MFPVRDAANFDMFTVGEIEDAAAVWHEVGRNGIRRVHGFAVVEHEVGTYELAVQGLCQSDPGIDISAALPAVNYPCGFRLFGSD